MYNIFNEGTIKFVLTYFYVKDADYESIST